MAMTMKEAVIKSLNDINGLTNYKEVFDHIVTKDYYDFGAAKTPTRSIAACLGDFIRDGDARVKRIKRDGHKYFYYLTKNEQNIDAKILAGSEEDDSIPKKETSKTYAERDLHILLSSYLKNTKGYSKTIFHEQSKYGKDSNQI